MPGLGDEFRAAREARHLSLSDVSEQIHIRSVYLQSIEEEDWAAVGAPVYVRGFMRTYARFLGIDAERAVATFNAAIGEAAARPHDPVRLAAEAPPARGGLSPWIWAAGIVATALVAFVAYNFIALQNNDRSAPAHAVAVASAAPSAAPATAAPVSKPPARLAASRTLEVRLTQASWLLVRIDGSQAVEGIFPAGTRKAFHGKRADVRAGNAGGVDLTVNGRELGTMGNPGDVVERSFRLAEE